VNLHTILCETARRDPVGIAVARGTQAHQTWVDLDRRTRRLAGGLGRCGEPGARVLIASPNCAEYPEIMFGTWAAGMAVVPVNAKLHAREIADIATDAEPALVLAAAKIAPDLAQLDCPVIAIGSPAYEELFSGDPAEPVAMASHDLAWLFYTSGTTGKSKGAMLTHGNLAAMAEAHLHDIDDVTGVASLLHAAPLSHGSGLYLLPYVARGARQIVPASGGFDPAEFLALCGHHPGVRAFLAPTMVHRLRLAVEAETLALDNLELIIYGGGPMHVSDMRAALATFGPRFAQIYGQGESPMTITGLTREQHMAASDAVLGSVGKPRTGVKVKVVDGSGAPAAVGEPGEILCRGEVVMAGYWRNPAATSAALRDGWLQTGDIGCYDDDGFLTLLDRSKDVVISGGSNIYPREVEEVLLAHPAVAEATVLGEPHPEWGEIVVAHVVAQAGVPLSAEDLDAHCVAHIARFKRPKRYVFHDALPKNANGKVLKRALRES
jgi:acyl-CoA synthetase (AMP-forming)/AMP-acid ligase II